MYNIEKVIYNIYYRIFIQYINIYMYIYKGFRPLPPTPAPSKEVKSLCGWWCWQAKLSAPCAYAVAVLLGH